MGAPRGPAARTVVGDSTSRCGHPAQLGTRLRPALGRVAIRKAGKATALLRPSSPHRAGRAASRRMGELPLSLAHRRVQVVSGLADPSRLYGMLRDLGAELVGVLEYPDHHPYSASDWHRITTAARDAELIVTTEKDLTKLERFPFARDCLYALRLKVV